MAAARPSVSFRSAPPLVSLTKAFPTPFKNVIATARTCYSARGLVRDEDIQEGFEPLARSIYEAGHHTTYQHAHFQFALANVSRQFIWSFLHAHPFYNSEQVSQRYVPVKPGTYFIPALSGEALAVYEAAIAQQFSAYETLIEALRPVVTAEYRKLFSKHDPAHPKVRSKITKRAMEAARYVLPVATFAYLYHTVSGITLLRYWRLCEQHDAPDETRAVVGAMVEALLAHDPLYQTVLEAPLPPEAIGEFAFAEWGNGDGQRRIFRRDFDQSLGGYVSRLVDWKARNEQLLADSAREVLGLPITALSDDDAIRMVLDPARNRLLGESLNLTTHAKLTRALAHPGYTFRKKLSHTADSQDQRHRMTPGSRPLLTGHLDTEPDYETPVLVQLDARVERMYRETMARTWEAIDRLKALGVSAADAAYLLPNAVSIRFTESSDLLNLHHKHRMRLCYLAQEEIWRASVEEAQQIRAINPRIGRWLLPPCGQRAVAGARPICPEGERFCGVRVWKLDIDDYRRTF
ncbi:MAG: FAD-dependent thymidylate synthase [Chloracidobacterium sp.]|uniref:FAD-dependent thymidylate synthase n=1 Tax=Chloracidobacterium validum TaxID=2821543 RepID=A0ABX8B5S1_9BACT|nr:FAD-dependent thymidylate synthase [Chloracidobacterium validum]QUW02322.1 FAD-dependent thymidylate synthase [Chloracidobacterium validum]